MSLVAHYSELMSGGKLLPYDGVRMVDREGVGGDSLHDTYGDDFHIFLG